jgi:hypothetical protein
MRYSALNPIQIFLHYGVPFRSNDSAKLIFYGRYYCVVRLLE